METLRQFILLYPPQERRHISEPFLPGVLQSVTSKSIAQSASTSTVQDTPKMDFRDLNPLHHKLVTMGRNKEIKFVDRVAHMYARSSKPPKRSRPTNQAKSEAKGALPAL